MRTLLITVCLIAAPLSPAFGQDSGFLDRFENSGSVTVGQRVLTTSGYRPKLTELFGLDSGFRMQELAVNGQAREKGAEFADSYRLRAYGLGGEPFAGGEFRLEKAGAYDVRVDYRQSYFYWNRNDAADHPAGVRGLTSHHDFATVRKLATASAEVPVSSTAKILMEYARSSRDGSNFTTRAIEYFGAPATWGAFARANPYVLHAPADETSHRVAAGVSVRQSNWTARLRAGFQTYNEEMRFDSLGAGQRSLNLDEAATATELLQSAAWTQFRRRRAPFTETSYSGTISPKLSVRGGYIYYRYSGPARFEGTYAGVARTNSAGTAFAPYSITEMHNAEFREPYHVIDQGLSYQLQDWWSLHADYRYSRFNVESEADLVSDSSLSGISQGNVTRTWTYGLHIADLALEFFPAGKVVVRTGARLMKRDVTALDDGVAIPQATRRSRIVSPIGSIYYVPSSRLRFRADIQSTSNDGPYTRITPRTDIMSRFVGTFQAHEKLRLENSLQVRTGKYSATEFRNAYRSNSTTLTYEFSSRYAGFAGFSYDSSMATASVTFLRGPGPLEVTWRDQTINRVWQAGVTASPAAGLELRIAGNYLRTTGVGEISGEPPVYGPIRWPMVSATAAYQVRRFGTFSFDVQRTYYKEELVSADDFGGTLFGLNWTKEF